MRPPAQPAEKELEKHQKEVEAQGGQKEVEAQECQKKVEAQEGQKKVLVKLSLVEPSVASSEQADLDECQVVVVATSEQPDLEESQVETLTCQPIASSIQVEHLQP